MIRLMTKISQWMAIAVAVFGLNATASATLLTVPPQSIGNHGVLFFPVGANFSLTSLTLISKALITNPLAPGVLGTVTTNAFGAGVQSTNPHNYGSQAIDGAPSSTHSDEQLTAHFAGLINSSTLTIGLSNLNLKGTNLHSGSSPWIYIQHGNSAVYTVVNKATWGAAFTLTTPSTGVLNVGLLGLADFKVGSVSIREDNQFTYVSSISGKALGVPEPGTWLLMASGLFFVGCLKHRKENLLARAAARLS